jgi:hypothetical protein
MVLNQITSTNVGLGLALRCAVFALCSGVAEFYR